LKGAQRPLDGSGSGFIILPLSPRCFPSSAGLKALAEFTAGILGTKELCMKFSDFVCGPAIRAELNADDKEGAIRELVGALVEANALQEGEKENIVKAIMKREELGSTGIGRGVAVPHTKHSSVEKLVGTVGVSATGVRRCSCSSCSSRRPIDQVITCEPWKTSRGSFATRLSAGS
jgi:hypothetical protein